MNIESSLTEFVRIVELGSISAAARELGVPRVSLSRRLSGLEDEFGVTLIHRTTRQMALTEAGETLYRRARKIAGDVEDLYAAMVQMDDEPRGLLRVSVPPGVQEVFAQLCQTFLEECPNVTIEVIATSRYVDVISEGIDVALRGGQVKDPNLKVKRVAKNFIRIYASPILVERFGEPQTFADLSVWPFILPPIEACPDSVLDLGADPIPVRVGMRTNDMLLRLELGVAGVGAIAAPHNLTTQYLQNGSLVCLLEDQVDATGWLSIVWPDSNFMSPKVRAFVDHAHAFMRAELEAMT